MTIDSDLNEVLFKLRICNIGRLKKLEERLFALIELNSLSLKMSLLTPTSSMALINSETD